MLTELDLNLKLLRGLPIEVYEIKVYPITLSEIVSVTYEEYNKFLNWLCIDEKTIKQILDITDDISVFEFVLYSCKANVEYNNLILSALEFFIKEKISLCNLGFLIKNNKIINQDIFYEIIKIIKLQNCVTEKEIEEKIKPANERARRMLEQMRKNQEELNKAKKKDSLNLYDLISIFAAYSENINIFNVWDLTFYQFNDQFNRLKIMKDFDANLQVLMHCSTKDNKVELKHWLTRGE